MSLSPEFTASHAAFIKLRRIVEKMASTAPEDCDVVVEAGVGEGQPFLIVGEISYTKPDTITFRELSTDAYRATLVVVEGEPFFATVDITRKSVGARIVTRFVDRS